MNSMYKNLIVKEVKEEIKDVKTIVFDENRSDKIIYKAGQYLTLVQQGLHEEIRRSYSITSSPALNEPLSVGVKRINNGAFSRQLVDHTKAGDTILTIGAAGFFVLHDNLEAYRQIFFLAAGSGITPIYSLIKTVLHQHPHIAVVVIYSNRSEHDTIFKKELSELLHSFAHRFVIEFIYSNSKDLRKAHLYRELLQEYLNAYSIASFDEMLFYVCGPEAYMRMCVYGLEEVYVPQRNIKKENFSTVKASVVAEPPDKLTHKVCIDDAGRQNWIEVLYPETILQAAKKNGLQIPYSCEAGRCGSCVAACIKGKVWMSYNEVLTDMELEKGYVLTCVGYPVGGDVVLRVGA